MVYLCLVREVDLVYQVDPYILLLSFTSELVFMISAVLLLIYVGVVWSDWLYCGVAMKCLHIPII